MSSTQSIIVYRNPMEQQLYESGMLFPIIVACFVFFITYFIVSFIADKLGNRRFKPSYRFSPSYRHGSMSLANIMALSISFITFALTIHFMMI